MKSQSFNISLPQALIKELDKQAEKEMTSRSDIVRRASLLYVRNNPLELWGKLAPTTSRLAREKGIFTEQDVVRMTKNIRAEMAKERAAGRN